MITILEIAEKLNLQIASGHKGLQKAALSGYTCDLLSDVMGNITPESIWITMQTHKNVMAVASLKDISAVIIVNNYKPEDDLLQQSDIEEIPILISKESAFVVSGKIYQLLNSK